ncbi:DUF4878 domain-containing protein [Mycobacterium sp. 236(2023)]|uniref:Rv0361 family membrane protein n=1 Tax=Mycobacterium sp. 236(2023) TaxID=3038163 RepID=UPI00241556D3|nr:DUF4878 domain-containing protein [Mycobacterium sp. 236(2023)]MDG4663309.1 DUF4878 domain-containing protein [Mycobacterium sp. 236(2023)]
MSNPQGPDNSDEPTEEVAAATDAETEVLPGADPEHEPATEVFAPAETSGDELTVDPNERRFTAPSGFDAGSTQIISRSNDPATEQFAARDPGTPVAPQMIPPRDDAPKPPKPKRKWGWAIAIVLVIAALAAVAVLGTILLTRESSPAVSQEDHVRTTIQNYDAAIEKGDLATLRSITCGTTAEGYNNLDDKKWTETHQRVADAGRYPVVASIDQIVVNGDHAEANVTTFMAFAPQTRSTRSFDLQFRDDQWKICQAPQ